MPIVKCIDIDGDYHDVDSTDLRWRPSAYAIVLKDNKLLVSPQQNGIDLPGGGIELGETPEQAVIREVKEETGLTVGNPKLLVCASNFFKLPMTGDGAFVQSILLYYACDYIEGELSDSGFTEDEKVLSKFPEWVALNDTDIVLADGRLGSSYDWRPLISKAQEKQ